MRTIDFAPDNERSIQILTTDQLLKLLEVIHKVDGSSTGDQLKQLAYRELQRRIGFDSAQAPQRDFIDIDTSTNCMA